MVHRMRPTLASRSKPSRTPKRTPCSSYTIACCTMSRVVPYGLAYTSVDTYTTTCPLCQRCKHRHGRPLGKSQPLPIPERPWQSISLDLIPDLPKSHRGDVAIAIFVCRLSKMMRVIPVNTNITAERLAEVAYD
ncbi:hypothetical protein VaNZ11_015820 [Volvox africanus]|uniref:Uncharacterized protein n=1 Tax=Volvox africanus TaxID=51714 RepID=A0ABQ5SLE0_9CHLO|nr:hypothetical protein VaNZ11_015820 [Volvox africanus]